MALVGHLEEGLQEGDSLHFNMIDGLPRGRLIKQSTSIVHLMALIWFVFIFFHLMI